MYELLKLGVLFPCKSLLRILSIRWEVQIWRDAELVDPNTHNNKLATHHSWFATPFSRNECMPTIVPRYLHLDLSKHVMRNVSRLRLQAHSLKVEAAAWLEDGSRVCDQCPGKDEHVQYASTLVNQRPHFDVFFSYFFVFLSLAFSSCVTVLFLLGLFWGLLRSHRLSSRSRLNAFVIQAKQNYTKLSLWIYLWPRPVSNRWPGWRSPPTVTVIKD